MIRLYRAIGRHIRSWGRGACGFTVVELLSASLLTLFFFGWLTYAYVVVTRTVLRWQEDWALASETHRALGRLSRDLEYAVSLDEMDESRVRLTRADGQEIIYEQGADGMYRNDRKWGGVGVTIASLHLIPVGEPSDPVAGTTAPSEDEDEAHASMPPLWLGITLRGQAKGQTYAARTTVRLYSLKPRILR